MLPTPPDGLRHWQLRDAAALEDAWSDPAIAAWNRPPAGMIAEEWILGVTARWERRLALDLVVPGPGGEDVAGEVGLRNFTTDPPRAELGVWIAVAHRRRGLARHAVDTLTRWAIAPGGLGLAQVWARTAEGNEPARGLFADLGWQCLGDHDGNLIWAASAAVLG